MIDRIIDEINVCLNSNCFLVALNMALTLPDICGKAEYPEIEKNSDRYCKWYNKYILKYEKNKILPNNFYLNGEVVWSLRNNTLHQATFNFAENKIEFEDYELFIQSPNHSVLIGNCSVLELRDEDEKNGLNKKNSHVIKRFLSVSVLDLIYKICACAKKYYNDNKEKFNFLKNKIVLVDYRTRKMFINKPNFSYENVFNLDMEKSKSKWNYDF